MNTLHSCPHCGAMMLRIPDDRRRYASGNNIYTSSWTLIEKIPVIRYVCGRCGYVENWIDSERDLKKIREKFG